jgi:hypothetical protein
MRRRRGGLWLGVPHRSVRGPLVACALDDRSPLLLWSRATSWLAAWRRSAGGRRRRCARSALARLAAYDAERRARAAAARGRGRARSRRCGRFSARWPISGCG